MTREEAKKIVRIIKESYPNWKPNDLATTIDVWASILVDDDYKVIEFGLFNYIRNDTSGFAPSIGQVRNSALSACNTEYDDTEEMMALVRKAVSNGYYGFESEYAKLPPLLQRAVGDSKNLKAWATIDINEFENVQLSHVRRSYRAIKENEKQMSKLKPLDRSRMLEINKNLNKLLGNKEQRLLPFEE